MSLQHAEEHLFERRTVSKDHELLTEALRHGRGSVDIGELRGTYELEVSQGKLLQMGVNVATQTSLERERSMVAAVDHGINLYPSLGGNEHFEPRASLRPEQWQRTSTIGSIRPSGKKSTENCLSEQVGAMP